ncbi:Transcriptional regulator, LacI family [Bifidobacterium actinocoloniiforme DSM 22766]|uniref:Transcriptional regulator, LacI family n=1 Tax=Bifidobacterium actinocoloniiforme DSM 22766 TaxID=1437605 RepID=A0A086Z227_9BIFI|nr:LacI family DNA-binding transcriptional regulator [Bifidobacterium actinocoloniiforme]AKV55993.1 LacI family transcriptional regulator [Bifidobacterium actinocoloniiforme DSM 22766]KFI40577.1 Transcriptional regulator, LacI family [Bifidobacterium actinocoloniiforme DSM 22766]
MPATRRGSNRPSIFQVAHLAGVSHQTVSRVINHSPDVSAPTRAKVQDAINRLGYRPSNSARALASARSRTIGLIAGGVDHFGPVSSITSIESIARQHGLFMSVMMVDEASCTQADFESMCESFLQQNVDAFIFLTPTDAMFEAACKAQVSQPRVIVTSTHGAMRADEGLSLVRDSRPIAMTGIDQWGAVQEVARLLHARGHRTALYMAGPTEWRDAATRLDSWRAAAKHYRIRTVVVRSGSWRARESYALMNHLIDERGMNGSSLPSVVVTADDNQAVGAARALHEHGLRIPQDISLVGFDDIPTVDNMYPPLTTVRPRFADLGVATMRQALALTNQGAPVELPVTRHGVGLIQADLVLRSSLGHAVSRL